MRRADRRRRWRWAAAILIWAAAPLSGASAAALEEQTAWAAWFSSVRLGGDWSLVSDVQLRSSDDAERVRNGLLRAGISYALTPSLSLAAGYARISAHDPDLPTQVEHRTWQQAVAQHRLAGGSLTHRLRLEQRSIDAVAGEDIDSDRLRYFARWLRPLPAGGAPFTRGVYAALQNETFVHLSGEDSLNGQRYDQNRAYAGLGFRLGLSLDLEAGYLNQSINGRSRDVENHVLQLSVHTRF